MSDIRGHIIVGAITPATEAGRLWHAEWHSIDKEEGGNPGPCGGCGFLGRILAIEAESRDAGMRHEQGVQMDANLAHIEQAMYDRTTLIGIKPKQASELRDTPRDRLLRALEAHPNATYVRVEVIDLHAILEGEPV